MDNNHMALTNHGGAASRYFPVFIHHQLKLNNHGKRILASSWIRNVKRELGMQTERVN